MQQHPCVSLKLNRTTCKFKNGGGEYRPEVTAKLGSDCQRYGGLYFRQKEKRKKELTRNYFWRIKFQGCVLAYSGLKLRSEYAKIVWVGRSDTPWHTHTLTHTPCTVHTHTHWRAREHSYNRQNKTTRSLKNINRLSIVSGWGQRPWTTEKLWRERKEKKIPLETELSQLRWWGCSQLSSVFATLTAACTYSRTSTDANPNDPFWALCYISLHGMHWQGEDLNAGTDICLTSLKQTATLPNGHAMSLTRQGKGYGWNLERKKRGELEEGKKACSVLPMTCFFIIYYFPRPFMVGALR